MSDKGPIDLNADLGEADDPAAIARDRAMMRHISSCNIASGGHAGSEPVMRLMLRAAKAAGVAAGVHPSYPDRDNFGRVSMAIDPDVLRASLTHQIDALAKIARQEDVMLTHAKPHGALYNDAADDRELAVLIAETLASALPGAALVGLAGSEMAKAADKAGLRFIGEGFADRAYTPQRRLQPRGESGAVIETQEARLHQALALATGEPVRDCEGGMLTLAVDTICLHSDSDGALESAALLREGLEAAGFRIGAP